MPFRASQRVMRMSTRSNFRSIFSSNGSDETKMPPHARRLEPTH
jgi:hypothetical protein